MAILPEDVLKSLQSCIALLRADWNGEIPTRIHGRDYDAGGAPQWHPEFRRWIERGHEEGGLNSSGKRLPAPRNPDSRLRTTRAMRKLRRKAVREFEVLYRTVALEHPLAETQRWLNERAIRNDKPERYDHDAVLVMLYSAVDKVMRWR